MKLCECGCGNPSPIATTTYSKFGWVKGQPKRFIQGHSTRLKHPNYKHGAATKHGTTDEYRSFYHAKARCMNTHDAKWPEYGGRGIKFLFTSFKQFFTELGQRPAGKTLDRINNDGNYEPGNVRWATKSEQAFNRRPWNWAKA